MNQAEVPAVPTRGQRLRQFLRQIGPAGPMALLATCMPLAGAIVLFSCAHVIAPWLRNHGWLGLALFVVAFATLGGFALVPTYANSILGGWTYGFGVGYPAVMIGLVGAAAITYAGAKRMSGHRVEQVIHQHAKWEVVRTALIGRGKAHTTWIVILLRLSPLLPFETTSVLLAVTGVETGPFLVGTLIGVAPRTAAIVFAASRAEQLDLAAKGSWWLAASGIVATICGAVIIALISKHALDRATGGRDVVSSQ